MSAGKGDTPRPLSVSRDAFAEAYERTFGAKQPPREMTDPTTCAHRNKQLIGGALDGSWDKYGCADCGTSFKFDVRAFHGVGKQDALMSSAMKIIEEHKPALEYLARGEYADEVRHVCGLTGYNPMIDPPCPACMERAARWEEKKNGAGGT